MISFKAIFILFVISYVGLFLFISTRKSVGLQQAALEKKERLNFLTKNELHSEARLISEVEQIKDEKDLLEELPEMQKRIKKLETRTKQLENEKKALERKEKALEKELEEKNHDRPETQGLSTIEEANALALKFQTSNPFYLLGAYPDVSYSYPRNPRFSEYNFGINNDDNYCHKVDLYNLKHPENMFSEQNFFTDYPKNALPRVEVMQKIGKVMMSQIYKGMKTEDFESRKYNLSLKINNFFNNFDGPFDNYHKIGQHFGCATQMYNHIPGHTSLIRKDAILDSLDLYAKKYLDRPHCFHRHLYFPRFFRLYNEEECQAFFELINSHKYLNSLEKEPIQYLVKIGRGSHKGQGVFLLDENETKELNSTYNNGEKCGQLKSPLIAQGYVTNPLLLDMKNKFDFRLYVLIASTNPLIVYYHDGFLRVSLNPFNKASKDKATHLTNTFLANQKIEDAKNQGKKLNGMTEEQLKEYHLWSFERLQDYLLTSRRIADPNWLDNYLRPSFHKVINHIIKMTSGSFLKLSNLYELLGFDFILDDNMNLWFIESNPSPLLTGTTKHMIYHEVVEDLFEITYAYYRSRMKRMLDVIKRMNQEKKQGKLIDYNRWREEFQEASKNRLEPEYKISENNSYTLIMDENLPGSKAYFGLISEECVLNY